MEQHYARWDMFLPPFVTLANYSVENPTPYISQQHQQLTSNC